ncbi:MAG: hypothetical protein WAT09_06795 [Paracoccaceae bacterium]
MIVTHPKIATLLPEWALFQGFSLILEGRQPDGGPFSPDAATAGTLARIAAMLQEFGHDRLMRGLLLCLLPPETHHVTFADLLHQGQLGQVQAGAKEQLAQTLQSADGGALLRHILHEEGPAPGAPLALRIGGLTRLGGSVAALTLQPLPAETGPDPWPAALGWRARVLQRVTAATGLQPPPFRPHLTLGYFANPGLVAEDNATLAALSVAVEAQVRGAVLSWAGVGLYRFASMAQFCRLAGLTP